MRRWKIVAAAKDIPRGVGRVGVRRPIRKKILVAFLIAAAVGALFGGVLRLAWPPVARANSGCIFPLYNTQVEDGSHRGMRSAQMTVEDYSTACAEIDSMGAINGNSAIEIGTAHEGSEKSTSCDGGSSHSAPYLFFVWQVDNSSWCYEPSGQPVVAWAKEGFAVDDQNGDYNWHFWHNGNSVSDPFGTINFNQGLVVTNTERHDKTGDSAWGHFEQNYFMPLNGSWTAWTSAAECGNGTNGATSNDPTFNNQIWSASNITVSTGSSQNCNN